MASASDLSSAVSTERVREYYNTTADRERFRLSRSTVGRIEFSVNLHFIRKYVPIGCRVLDLGGGAGPYTLALAKAGYRVVLADLSPELLALARAEIARSHDGSSVEDVLEADARDLSAFPDNSFDAVLSLGPFYHLTQQDDRIRAAQELGRVLAPAGHAFVAYMPRTTLLRWLVARASETGTWHRGELRAALTEGVYRVDKPGSFTEGYYPVPFEMQSLMSGAGIQTIR
ncbi:MAG: class I SAM-dependent methyltransferase, partial [Chloroflexota bacterium]|nr:class I SAM-dependent methyltransferase [Chloroflexota bacterium]